MKPICCTFCYDFFRFKLNCVLKVYFVVVSIILVPGIYGRIATLS